MNAIPFHSSVRIRLSSGMPIKDKAGNVIGVKVIVTNKKNKVAHPYRKCEFEIHFGVGIVEHEQLFDELNRACKANGPVVRDGLRIQVAGDSAWKELTVSDPDGVVLKEKKFYKSDFGAVMKDPEFKPFLDLLIDGVLTVVPGAGRAPDGASDDGSDSKPDDAYDE